MSIQGSGIPLAVLTATPGCTMTYQASGSVDGGQPLAHALPPRRRNPEQKQVHPRPGAAPGPPAPSTGRPQSQSSFSASEGGRRIRAAAPETPAHGDALAHPQARTRAGCRSPPSGRAPPAPPGRPRAARPAGPAGRSISPSSRTRHAERVGKIDQLEERLQLVVAVGAAAGHVQEQIQFRRGGPVGLGRDRSGAPPPGSLTAASPRPAAAPARCRARA